MTSSEVSNARSVLKITRRYRECELGKLERKRADKLTRKLRPNEDGFYEVKYTLLRKLKNLEIPDRYADCTRQTKRRNKVKCLAANIKIYFERVEIEKGFKFVFV